MLTRCPACATVFRLDTVQLRAREGRVRCGRCHTVFDAVDAMVELPLPRSAAAPAQADSDVAADAPPPEHSHATLSVLAAPAIETPAQSPADVITDWPPEEAPGDGRADAGELPIPQAGERVESLVERTTDYWATQGANEAVEPDLTDAPVTPQDALRDDDHDDAIAIDLGAPLDAPADTDLPAADPDITQPVPVVDMLAELEATDDRYRDPDASERGTAAPAIDAAPAEAPLPADDTAAEAPASTPRAIEPDPLLDVPARLEPVRDPAVQRIRRELYGDAAPAGRSLIATVLWTTGCTLLALAAIAQLIYAFRTELAVAQPALKPVLERACERLGCSVPAPRRADLISIESSELNPDRERAPLLRLNALLRNGAAFPQAWPHLELTLTDTVDRPVLRRVIAPEDYLAAADRPETFTGNSEHAVSLLIDPGTTSAGGYRLYVFHP